MFYFVKTPTWLKRLYPSLVWEKAVKEKILYLTFDDGPHPTATTFILEQLKEYDAKATFFCIGKNVAENMQLYSRILEEGHRVGNHTFNHLNGWSTDNAKYLKNIFEAAKYIDSNLFRPPYGKITKFQAKLLQNVNRESVIVNDKYINTTHHSPFTIIMWTVLSGDFDTKISPERCLQNVVLNAKPGSIIVFHDSEKAWELMHYALPRVLQHYAKEGYTFHAVA